MVLNKDLDIKKGTLGFSKPKNKKTKRRGIRKCKKSTLDRHSKSLLNLIEDVALKDFDIADLKMRGLTQLKKSHTIHKKMDQIAFHLENYTKNPKHKIKKDKDIAKDKHKRWNRRPEKN